MGDEAAVSGMEWRAINVIRGLAMDGPAAAKSGHQGTAMALAPLAHVLWTRLMSYDATDPGWLDRDRFVLSAGHASILQYSMLYLTGYGLSLDDLRDFRQWGSPTPGHPEVGHTAGVEVTTGPLGQGLANSVGMAVAEASMRARFGSDAMDHHIWCIAGDGDLSEGVSHEAASFAGHQRLGRLNVVYDDNRITIDGPTDLALSDDAAARFESYGWHVVRAGEVGEDLDAIESALREAAAVDDRPSLVVIRTHIGYPSPTHVDSPAAHGLAFGAEDITEAKAVMGIPDEPFWVPDDVVAYYRAAGESGRERRLAWEKGLDDALDGRRAEWDASWEATGLDGFPEVLPSFDEGQSIATRSALSKALTALCDVVPGLVAGGADLTGNTGTALAGQQTLSPTEPAGRQVAFGVREHAMGSIMNGMALHGGLLPVGGTFLVFSDYMRPAVRLAALMGTKVVFAWSHDSVGVGEDGPTHQPVEHVAALRAIPGLTVWRPGDANETMVAVRAAMESEGPSALILTRQNVPVLAPASVTGAARGGYVLADVDDAAVTLVATGSEVSVALESAARLGNEGLAARVVSLPSWEVFESQDAAYRDQVLGSAPRVAIEAQVSFGWYRWADEVVAIDRFGASAPGPEVMERLGISVDATVAAARSLLAGAS